MMTVLPFVTQGAMKTLAVSALPDAPVVHEANHPRRTSLVSRVLHRR